MNKSLIIRRMNTNDYSIEVIGFSLKDAMKSPKSDMDPILELHDEILIFSNGFNNNFLNNIEIYDPYNDIEHPSYNSWKLGMAGGENPDGYNMTTSQMNDSSQTISAGMFEGNAPQIQNQIRDLMTSEELRIVIYETRKQYEYKNLNEGKRRLLLTTVIEKLNQQATSLDSSKLVSISGAVKIPGTYPLIKSASYQDLIEMAGGYRDDAYIEVAEIRRATLSDSGALIIDTSNVNLMLQSDEKMNSLDHLFIRTVKDWDSQDTVILSGEVFYPGSYLISPNEKLSSVIERAGGFTAESFIEGAVFTRDSIKEKEMDQLQELGDSIRRDQAARSMTKEGGPQSSDQIEASISALLSSVIHGRLIINIPRVIEGDASADFVLQNGDELLIPKFTNAVTVVGEVRRSGSFVHQGSFDINDYLQLAAGITDRGDKKEVYVIRANGSVTQDKSSIQLLTFKTDENIIKPGDTIVVPIKSSYQTPLNLYSTVSQVVFQSIASIAAFITVAK